MSELLEYLKTLITPNETQGVGDAIFIHATGQYPWHDHADASVHGIVLETDINNLQEIEEAHRVLKPGGHLLLVSPDADPTGYLGACQAEDTGFEVRDCIMVPDRMGDGDLLHYSPKASRSEREAGLAHLPKQAFGMSGGAQGAIQENEDYGEGQDIGLNRVSMRVNNHPTVKPIKVMELLLSDIPQGSTVMDPFMGSGTTGIACAHTGHNFIGVEMNPDYLTLAEGRIRHWAGKSNWGQSFVISDKKELVDETPKTLTLDDLFGI